MVSGRFYNLQGSSVRSTSPQLKSVHAHTRLPRLALKPNNQSQCACVHRLVALNLSWFCLRTREGRVGNSQPYFNKQHAHIFASVTFPQRKGANSLEPKPREPGDKKWSTAAMEGLEGDAPSHSMSTIIPSMNPISFAACCVNQMGE